MIDKRARIPARQQLSQRATATQHTEKVLRELGQIVHQLAQFDLTVVHLDGALQQGARRFQTVQRFGYVHRLPRVQFARRLFERGGHLDVNLTEEYVARKLGHESVQRTMISDRTIIAR